MSCPEAFSCLQSLLLPAASLLLIARKHRLCCRSRWHINVGFLAFSCGLRLITGLVLEGIQSNGAQAHSGLQGTSRGDGRQHFPVLPSSGTRMELITLPSALLCSWWPRSQCWNDPVLPQELPVLESSKTEAPHGPFIMSLLFQLKPVLPQVQQLLL